MPRRSKAKDKLVDLIEEAIDARIEEIVAHCEKRKLSYSVDICVWKWGEQPREAK